MLKKLCLFCLDNLKMYSTTEWKIFEKMLSFCFHLCFIEIPVQFIFDLDLLELLTRKPTFENKKKNLHPNAVLKSDMYIVLTPF